MTAILDIMVTLALCVGTAGAVGGCCFTLTRALQKIASSAAGGASFPLGVRDSFAQWWRNDPEACERRVLDRHCGVGRYRSRRTYLDDATFINEVELDSSSKRQERRVVVLHGFGSGVGFFAPLYRDLARYGRVSALDWPGMGLSSRAPISRIAYSTMSEEERCRHAEDFFIDALEAWRVERGIERMTIVAHSFGAYLATRYVNKYGGRCDGLCLVSPVGVNESPFPTDRENPLAWYIKRLWNAHLTPFDFVRAAGPLGPKLCSAWSVVAKDEALAAYAYAIFSRAAGSERFLSWILQPGAHARMPLIDSLPTDVPCQIIYGENDWMSIDAGAEAVRRCNKLGGDANIDVVPDAGHHPYVENKPAFLSALRMA